MKKKVKQELINPEKLCDMLEDGATQKQIAKAFKVSQPLISQYLKENRNEIEHFRSRKADSLALMQIKAHDLRLRCLDALASRDFDKMSVNELKSIIQTLTISAGIDYDKERLERGLSTSNHAHLMLIAQRRADSAQADLINLATEE